MSILNLIAAGGNNRVGESFIKGQQTGQQMDMNALRMAAQEQQMEAQEFNLGQAKDEAGRQDALRRAIGAGEPEQAMEEAPLLTEGYLQDKRAKEANIRANEAGASAQELQNALNTVQHGSRILGAINDEATFQQARPILEQVMGEGEVPETYDPNWVEQNRESGLRLQQYMTKLGTIEEDIEAAEARGNQQLASILRRQQQATVSSIEGEAEDAQRGPQDVINMAPTPEKNELATVRSTITNLPEDSPLNEVWGDDVAIDEEGNLNSGSAEAAARYWGDQAKAYQQISEDAGLGTPSFSEALQATRPMVEEGVREKTETEKRTFTGWIPGRDPEVTRETTVWEAPQNQDTIYERMVRAREQRVDDSPERNQQGGEDTPPGYIVTDNGREPIRSLDQLEPGMTIEIGDQTVELTQQHIDRIRERANNGQ